jgi:hypothetical protein
MVILMASGIAGGLVTSLTASLWFGPVGSIVLAPFGGSLAAVAAALAVAGRRSDPAEEADASPDMLVTTDAQVKALREIAAQGRAHSVEGTSGQKASGRAA